MVAILAENDPILKGRLPSTLMVFGQSKVDCNPFPVSLRFTVKTLRFALGSDPTMRGRRHYLVGFRIYTNRINSVPTRP
jgi:hypothetical protein